MCSMWYNSAVHCFEQSVDHTTPIQSGAEQNPVIFDLYKPSRTISVGISLAEVIELGPIVHHNLGHRHSESVFEQI